MSTGIITGRPTARPTSVRDHLPVRCVLEMNDLADLTVIVTPGCSIEDVHDMLRLLTLCHGHFAHVTYLDEDLDLL